jgi:hypothetical protein
MVENHSSPKGRREFRVRFRTLYFVLFGIVFFSALPALSLYELFTTGTIDWMAEIGGRRRALPRWVMYLVFWSVFFFYVIPSIRLFRYVADPLMFALDDEAIEIDGNRIPQEHVLSIRQRWWRSDILLETTTGNYSIRPYQVSGGVSALQEVFHDRFNPRYLKDAPSWLVGV